MSIALLFFSLPAAGLAATSPANGNGNVILISSADLYELDLPGQPVAAVAAGLAALVG